MGTNSISLWLMALLVVVGKVQSQDVTSFTIDRFDPNPNDLTYQGDATVPSGSSFLRLTKTTDSGVPASWSLGRVLYSRPVEFWASSPARQATFETTIHFAIQPSANGAADGLVFFIAPVNFPIGVAGADFGVFRSGRASSVFAVEFDTFINPGDPNYRHIGIDIESRTSSNTTRFDSATGAVVTARINYNSNTNLITVVATSGSQEASLQYSYDLKNILPQQVQVGVSAATGQTTSYLGIHDFFSWQFTSTLVRDDAYIQQVV